MAQFRWCQEFRAAVIVHWDTFCQGHNTVRLVPAMLVNWHATTCILTKIAWYPRRNTSGNLYQCTNITITSLFVSLLGENSWSVYDIEISLFDIICQTSLSRYRYRNYRAVKDFWVQTKWKLIVLFSIRHESILVENSTRIFPSPI